MRVIQIVEKSAIQPADQCGSIDGTVEFYMFDGFDLFDQLALFQMLVIRTQCQYRDFLIFLFGVGVLRVLRKRFHVTIRCGWSP